MRLACGGLSLHSRLGQHFLEPPRSRQPLCSRRPQRRYVQIAVQSAAGAEGPSSRGGGSGGKRRRRESVTFVVPEQGIYQIIKVTQSDLADILDKFGALGFEVAGGAISRRLEDLPEGGTVRVVMPPLAMQGSDVDLALIASNRAKLEAFLRSQASAEAPGDLLTALQTAPFIAPDGQERALLYAAVVVGDTVLVGQYTERLGRVAVGLISTKAAEIRDAAQQGLSPDLASALRGVAHLKLFLCGEAVLSGLAFDDWPSKQQLLARPWFCRQGRAWPWHPSRHPPSRCSAALRVQACRRHPASSAAALRCYA